ncbi:MAG: hypothetical protein H7Y04_01420 [Verrucomicrobia bacterium]|nr:hypothetical protein [Cytophagales bacterium]
MKTVFNMNLLPIFTSCLLAIGLFTSACKDKTEVAAPLIKLESSNATLGKYLTDQQGNTLYFFAPDLSGTNNCTGGCAALWPVFYQENLTQATLGEDLLLSDFSSITGTDGRLQTTYKGYPLYYYAPAANGQNIRELPLETKGEGVGNVWFVAKSDYTLLLARASVTDKTTNVAAVQRFLVYDKGLSLYFFKVDTDKPTTQPTNCTGGCIQTWPVFYNENITIPSFLNKGDFGFIERPDGANGTTRRQTTYQGKPLYYFRNDNLTKGKVEGQGVNNVWTVANY